jgi:hypothetical protein
MELFKYLFLNVPVTMACIALIYVPAFFIKPSNKDFIGGISIGVGTAISTTILLKIKNQ